MSKSVFPYPGGKTYMANWILDYFPDHDCYVEVFGGSAGLLVNKERSRIEIFNDIDGDIVHFFRVLRDRGGELREWLENTPYSRELHNEYADEYYAGHRPSDDIERAGKFLYLRSTQFAGKYPTKSGFLSGKESNHPGAYINRVRALDEFSERFRGVTIESGDYEKILGDYDKPDTLFYCDPPYVGSDEHYNHGEFDHERFVETIRDIEGMVMVSYEELPPGLDGFTVVKRDSSPRHMSAGGHGGKKDASERLVMNFDPEQEPRFASAGQLTVHDL